MGKNWYGEFDSFELLKTKMSLSGNPTVPTMVSMQVLGMS
jgi:hypothetical protein